MTQRQHGGAGFLAMLQAATPRPVLPVVAQHRLKPVLNRKEFHRLPRDFAGNGLSDSLISGWDGSL